MSARISSRRLGNSALAAFYPRSIQWVPSISLASTTRRNISDPAKPTNTNEEDLSNPLLDQYLKRNGKENSKGPGKRRRAHDQQDRQGAMSKDPSSLFLPEREIPGWGSDLPASQQEAIRVEAEARKAKITAKRDLELSSTNLDPAPFARVRLERKLVIAGLKRRGRLTKAQTIARTERQSLFRSQSLPTSVKKLQKIVNQIAGKTVSEALVQLRFSKKKVARDVMKGLEIAQNEAIAGRGMGLGEAHAQQRWDKQRVETGSKDISIASAKQAHGRRKRTAKTVMVELKDGTKRRVTDASEIYIDQAWVGKGEMWMSPEFRARGKINMLRHRTTGFSVLLKEEKTRMRISDEIKKKRDNRKLWTALPDRPITTQRQYCLW
ncbi:ribosomal protein L22/L17 [Phaeosphaeriaceae sp. PMI808]|nr:ribosomal protein L22/L17 [Phaeosphaeriaceae sp. PMI808]